MFLLNLIFHNLINNLFILIQKTSISTLDKDGILFVSIFILQKFLHTVIDKLFFKSKLDYKIHV